MHALISWLDQHDRKRRKSLIVLALLIMFTIVGMICVGNMVVKGLISLAI